MKKKRHQEELKVEVVYKLRGGGGKKSFVAITFGQRRGSRNKWPGCKVTREQVKEEMEKETKRGTVITRILKREEVHDEKEERVFVSIY